MENRTSEIQFPCTFLHVCRGKNVLKFNIKHGDEKNEGPFIAEEIIILNGVYKDIEELSSRLIQDAKAPNHICISNNKTCPRQAEKLYDLAVKMMGIAKRLII